MSTESGEVLTGGVAWDLVKTCGQIDCRKKSASFNVSKISSFDEIGQLDLIVYLSSWQKCMTRRSFPFFLGTNMAGALYGP